MGDNELDPSDDDFALAHNNSRLQHLQVVLDDLSISHRFFGKSSGANLVQTALDLKSEYSGTEQDHFTLANRRPEFWTQHSVRIPPTSGRWALYPAHTTFETKNSGSAPPSASSMRLNSTFPSRT